MEGIHNLFSGMRTSSTGLSAERMRMDVIAENIANARTTRTATGGAYRRKTVVFEPILQETLARDTRSGGVSVARVIEDHETPMERILDPTHPHRGSDGMVEYPNVNTVIEMADMITSMRAYEANLTAQEGFMRMAERALELAR